MKVLLVLLCIVALTSAVYTSNWTRCGSSNEEWNPKDVFVTRDPKTANNTLVSACGKVNGGSWYTTFNYLIVNATDGVLAWTSAIPYSYMVPVGSPLCLNYTSDFSVHNNRDMSLRIAAINQFGDEVGCVDINLKYGDSQFLAFRK